MELSLRTDESFDEVMRLYIPTVYRIAFERLGNSADADDVTQEVFIRYFKADKTFESEEHRKFFLIRVTINCVNSFARSSWFKNRVHTDALENFAELSAGDTTAENTEKTAAKRAIIEAVLKLPEKYRTAVHLFYFEDMSIAQIAKVTNQKEATVKSQLSRARQKLKKLLNRNDFE
ncbi:MAG: sigma-70 family RNA polymerase sigma factor [Oscillospiraceae bacterium]|nr:sigma-70 family RNA polymerase sigma factor [Oscillospiraceae bacterium]